MASLPPPHDLPLGRPPKPTPGRTPVPAKTVLPAKTQYYTKRKAAQAAIGQDEPGVGVRFQKGRGYYLGAATGGGGGGGGSTLPPPAHHVSLTPAQEATLQVRQMLAPQYQQADVEAQRQNQAIQAYTAAVMRQLAGLGPSIGQDFSTAANQQQAGVDAAANALRAANPNGDLQSLLGAVGAPQAQQQQLAQNLGNTFNGGAAVGQYLGTSGVEPLRAQGLAASTLAKLQPGFTALAGRQSLLSALKSQSDARAQIGEQMPKLEQDWLSNFHTNQNQKAQIATEREAAGLNQANKNRDFSLSVDKYQAEQTKYIRDYNLRVREFNAQQTDATAKAALANSAQSTLRGYLTDGTGKAILDQNGKKQPIAGWKMNANGQVVKTYAPKTPKTPKGAGKPFADLTKTQVSTLRETANELRFGTKDANGNQKPALRYGQAIRFLVAHGFSRKDAVAMLNNFYPKNLRQPPKNPLRGKIG